MDGKWLVEPVVELPEHLPLHVADLLGGVGVSCDIGKVLDAGWIDLLILGCNQQCCHTNQLQLGLGHINNLCVCVCVDGVREGRGGEKQEVRISGEVELHICND